MKLFPLFPTFKTREQIKQETIEKIAYDFWEKSGCPENKSLEFWVLAEKEYKKNELLDSFDNEKRNSGFLKRNIQDMVDFFNR
jgi:hypothetical protein